MADEICNFLNITLITKLDDLNLKRKLEILDSKQNLSFAEWLFSPLLHQFITSKCAFQFMSNTTLKYANTHKPNGIWSSIWPQIIVPGVFAYVSMLLNISLILVTFTKIKDHKVCNWLLAFDALCQLFLVSPFVVNLMALLLQYSFVDYRICLGTLMASSAASYASIVALFLISAERLLIVQFPIKMNWIKETTISRFSLLCTFLSILFGIVMVFNRFSVITTINLVYDRLLFCNSGLYSDVMQTVPAFILLLLSVLNYATISALILWRHFKARQKKADNLAAIASNSDQSMRRMLRSVFVLSFVILVGWLLASVFRSQITYMSITLTNTIFVGSNDYVFNANLMAVFSSFFACVPIWASASAAPILMLSNFIAAKIIAQHTENCSTAIRHYHLLLSDHYLQIENIGGTQLNGQQ